MFTYSASTITKRLLPLYIATFFQGFVLWYAVEKVFMKSIGFNDETIMLTIVMLIANIPLGILADRWSRRGVLMLASLALIASSLIGGLSIGFWTYLIAGAFWGIFFACYAGIYDSIVYDVLAEEKSTGENFEYYYGRIRFIENIAVAIGALLSALVVHFLSLRATYWLSIPLIGASLIALYCFREPKEHKKEVSQLMGAHIKATFRAILQKGDVFWIVLALIFMTIGTRLTYEFYQLWLIALALPPVFFGVITSFLVINSGIGGFIAGRLRGKTVLSMGGLVLLGAVTLLVHKSALVIAAQAALLTGLVATDIIFSRYLHDTLASQVRTGASSVVTTLGCIAFLPVAFIFGSVSKQSNVFRASWVMIAIAVAIVGCMAAVLHNRRQTAAKS